MWGGGTTNQLPPSHRRKFPQMWNLPDLCPEQEEEMMELLPHSNRQYDVSDTSMALLVGHKKVLRSLLHPV